MTKRSTKTDRVTVGVIGGSGLYEMEGLTNVRAVRVATPFGKPSDEYRIGTLFGRRIAFLPRHGRGHRLMRTDINYRANIYGMKKSALSASFRSALSAACARTSGRATSSFRTSSMTTPSTGAAPSSGTGTTDCAADGAMALRA